MRDTIPRKDSAKIVMPVPPRADSTLRDTLAKRDSLHQPKPDSIKAPLAHAEAPVAPTTAQRLHWSRDSLFATGAITLADLLERVPGFTGFHTGWISSPAVGAWMGDTKRVRVFYDGYEVRSLDPRMRGLFDLTQLNLWSLEDATIEQAGEEIRVYLRSWRVRRTTAETRTDVSTGDLQSNMYRGFYGRRYDNGLALQFGAQQYGVAPVASVLGGNSDQTGVIGRVGWARGPWSADVFVNRIGRHRGLILRDPGNPGDSIRNLNSTRSDTYLRVGFADPDTSLLWAQVMAVGAKYSYTGIRTKTIAFPKTAADSALNAASLDSGYYRSQYLLTVGTVRGPLRVSATERLYAGGGKGVNSPSVRASFTAPMFTVSAFGEGKSVDSASRQDVTLQVTPLSFVSVVASAGRVRDDRVKDSAYTANFLRAEAGLRVRNLWLIGGVLRRDSVRITAPAAFDTLYQSRGEPSATGTEVAIRGQLWRLIHADVSAIRWNDTTGLLRPRYQTRSELFLHTNMLDRFPSGNLGISASLVHEYRSGVNFPINGGVVTVPGYRTISSLLEIRIASATVSWQFRNLLGERYSQVPGFAMPRQTNFYGVRWYFFN